MSANGIQSEDRASGVPAPHHLGAASAEVRWLILGVIAIAVIIAAFVIEAY
jgi:hypothetical protein